ncbi:hypothetical protein HZA33_00630 [Candidatus Pacearchaeota archaeon]|nr:hypothetical protein [Candidatus Pacearchaeota archaeon]
MKSKKGALELSVGTIVIVILAMAMLILGLVLVQSIMKGAKYNVDQLNDRVKDAIKKLFLDSEDKRIVFYLSEQTATITPGDTWGVAFGVRNDGGETALFSYETILDEVGQGGICPGINEAKALQLIKLGKTGSMNILSGEEKYALIKLSAPTGFPIGCEIRYRVNVKKAGEDYANEFFDINIKKKFAGLF